MSTKRNALGRGLGALIPSAPQPRDAERTPRLARADLRRAEARSLSAAPAEIPVDEIDPNPEQPRRVFDAEQLERLVDSIRRHGVLQPVVVRRAGSRFQLIVGERRWRAARAAGRSSIPAVVADAAPGERLELALVENVQRQDLNPIELAHAFQGLAAHGATQQEVGERVGLDRSTVANHLRLLELPRDMQEDVERGRLKVGHAKAVLQVQNPERRRLLRDRIVEGGLSVRQTEEAARAVSAPSGRARSKDPRRPQQDPAMQALVESLRQRFQTRVRIAGDGARGRVEIEYFGSEDLQRITDMLLAGAG